MSDHETGPSDKPRWWESAFWVAADPNPEHSRLDTLDGLGNLGPHQAADTAQEDEAAGNRTVDVAAHLANHAAVDESS